MDINEKVLAAFQAEHKEQLEGIRALLTALENDEAGGQPERIDEAFRLAHSLKGGARVCDLRPAETLAHRLENVFEQVRGGNLRLDQNVVKTINFVLDAIEDWMAALDRNEHPTDPREALTAVERLVDGESVASDRIQTCVSAGSEVSRRPLPDEPIQTRDTSERTEAANPALSETSKPTANVRNVDTVRISTESLDTLLRNSRELVTESVRQEQVSRALEEIRAQADQLQRERESIRRVAAASLHRMSTMPEFNHLSAYFETVDRGIQSLTRGTRQVCAVQKRNSWLLQSRSRQIQQNVRQARMVPAEAVYQGLRKLVRDLSKEEGKQIEFRVSGFDVRADRMVFQSLKDPLIHILRNCIVHGIESPQQRIDAGKSGACQVALRIETVGNRLTIEVDDDGCGIDHERVARRAAEQGLISQADVAERSTQEIENLIFLPGFSTSDQVTEIAGRGMGLSVVRDAVARLQGEVSVVQPASGGTRFRISVPMCVSTHRLLIVSCGDNSYAIPLHGIERLLRVRAREMETIEGKPIVTIGGRPVPLVSLTSALGLDKASLKVHGDSLQIAILKSNTRRVAVSVDAFLAERDLLIQDLDGLAESKAYLGAILLEDGHPVLVLNPSELLEHARPATHQAIVEVAAPNAEKRIPRVLVVDDSFTTRTLEKSILEANGYHVGIAVDGVEGLKKLKSEAYDLVISDVEMPHMDGFTLLEEIKKDGRLSSTPVILVTSRARREDQEKGLDLGADAYIIKQRFDHQSLLSTIRQVVHV